VERREFITLLSGAAAWRSRRARNRASACGASVRLLFSPRMIGSEGARGGVPAGARGLGLDRRGNLRIDYRWAAGDANRLPKYAAELVGLAPDVILTAAASDRAAAATTQTIPIVFVNVIDPVGSGYVASLARPGGNAPLHPIRLPHQR